MKTKSQIGRGSKNKGKIGEREVAALLREHGFEARRGQQFAGGGDSPDVVHDMEGFHIEVKRCEKFGIEASLKQAKKERGRFHGGNLEIPVIFHRKSRQDWVVVLDARDFLTLAQELYE